MTFLFFLLSATRVGSANEGLLFVLLGRDIRKRERLCRAKRECHRKDIHRQSEPALFCHWLHIFMIGPGKGARNSPNPFSVIKTMPSPPHPGLDPVSSEISQ